jgi:hypothetical protein
MTGAEGAGAAGAAAAAARQQRDQEEEEEVTPFNTDPSGAVEYKIIRSATGAFKNPAKFRAALEEEARAGWELVEKLDDSRVRLRRSVIWRQKDGELSQDPYRIKVGLSEAGLVLWVVLGTLGGMALLVGLGVSIILVGGDAEAAIAEERENGTL